MLPTWLSGKFMKYRAALMVICGVFVALMAFSRLSAGAHFLSDILFGFLIAFGITEVAKKGLNHHEETLLILKDLARRLKVELGLRTDKPSAAH